MDSLNLISKTCNDITNKLFELSGGNTEKILNISDNASVKTYFNMFGCQISLFSLIIICILLIGVLSFLYLFFFKSKEVKTTVEDINKENDNMVNVNNMNENDDGSDDESSDDSSSSVTD